MVNSVDTVRSPGSARQPLGLRDVHPIWNRSAFTERQFFVGDVVSEKSSLSDLVDDESEFAGGRAIPRTYEARYFDAEGKQLATRDDTGIRSECQTTRECGRGFVLHRRSARIELVDLLRRPLLQGDVKIPPK
jgi:hypothetical protein